MSDCVAPDQGKRPSPPGCARGPGLTGCLSLCGYTAMRHFSLFSESPQHWNTYSTQASGMYQDCAKIKQVWKFAATRPNPNEVACVYARDSAEQTKIGLAPANDWRFS
jgi:hypothetical protein